jgi:capsular polysaccharide biosynthesis protein
MSQDTLDLRRSIQIVRRHKLLMGITTTLGILAAVAYAVLNPPMGTSVALVLLPQSVPAQSGAEAAANGGINPYTATQEVIAKSNFVLSGALPHARPAMSLSELRSAVTIGSQTAYIISVSATAKTGADAAADANAVAESYIRDIGSPSNPGGRLEAQLLQRATSDTGPSLLKRIIMSVIFALVGAIVGALIGAVIALAFDRRDRRLRQRDEIANSIGIPVLASFPVGHPSDPREWARLLENYKPGALHALQLRRTLQQLEMSAAEADFARRNGSSGRWSFTVLSLSTDPGALAIGPQLATFAASQGIPTVLVIASQPDVTVTASLRAACASPSTSPDWPRHLRAIVSDADEEAERDATLAICVGVIDTQNPQVPDSMRTTATLLGVSAGAASADQLARIAVSVVSDGREITGILVANPDSADATTGHLPQLGRRGQRRMPTRMTGIATEIRR